MASRISRAEFDGLAREAVSEVLGMHGFHCTSSQRCTFYREPAPGLFHVVLLDPLVRLPRYDVKVFPQSPILEGEAWPKRFPDDLGVPTGSLSYLSSRTGVGPDQELYFCGSAEVFAKDFNARVRPALVRFALPYLDEIKSVADVGALNGLHPLYAEKLRGSREV